MDDISNNLIEQQLLRESPQSSCNISETESKESAKQKLAKDVQKDEVNANAGSSIWGISLRNQFVGLMVDELEQQINQPASYIGRDAAQRYSIVQNCVGIKFKRTKDQPTESVVSKLWDSNLACHIALILCLDASVAPKAGVRKNSTDNWKTGRPTIQKLEFRIADELYRQLHYRLVSENFPHWMSNAKDSAMLEDRGSSPVHVFNRLDKAINSFLASVVFNGDTTRAAGLRLEEWSRDQRLVVGVGCYPCLLNWSVLKEAGLTTKGSLVNT